MLKPKILILVMSALMFLLAVSAPFVSDRPIRTEHDTPLSISDPNQGGVSFDYSTIHFTENLGQWPSEFYFRAETSFGGVWFTNRGPVCEISSDSEDMHVVEIAFQDAVSIPVGLDKAPFRTNFFIGKESEWRTEISSYAQIVYSEVWPGVDVSYHFDGSGLKYDVRLSANAAMDAVSFVVSGATVNHVDGALVLDLDSGISINDGVPTAEYDDDGTDIPVSYAVQGSAYGFMTSGYDRNRSITIDPLVYSTYIGGSGNDRAAGLVVDREGCAYVTGMTYSINFPTTSCTFQNSAVPSVNNLANVFVLKLDQTGSNVLYSTFIGGSGNDHGAGIAIDARGNAYVTGFTGSTDFPTTAGAYQVTKTGASNLDDDVFVLKLDRTGSVLEYSTYVGGSGHEQGSGIKIDADGNAYIAGFTSSSNFPTTSNSYQRTYGGGDEYDGGDAFVFKLNPTGSGLTFSTYIGTDANDQAMAVALDPQRNIYITGYSRSSNFPTSLTAFQTENEGIGDIFVVKLDQTGTFMLYSTLVGGSTDDYATALFADDQGNVYVAGHTLSSNFPITTGSFQTGFGGVFDAFIFKLDPLGSNLLYSTFIGGNAYDKAYAVTVDANGSAYMTGSSNSMDFPTTYGTYRDKKTGTTEAYVLRLDPNGTTLLNSSYLGGHAWSEGFAIDISGLGTAHVAGFTSSTDFPVSETGFQRSYGGSYDAFSLMITLADALPEAPTDLTGTPGEFRVTLNWVPPVRTGANIDHYVIYRDGVDIDHVTTTTASVNDLLPGRSYQFYVRAHNSAGLGPPSEARAVAPSVEDVPTMPLSLTGVSRERQVMLQWSPPVYTGTSNLSGYYIYYGPVSANTIYGGLIPAGTTSWAVSGLGFDTPYHFAVSAFNGAGEGALSIPISLRTEEHKANITGRILDPSGNPMSDVKVELENGIYDITDSGGNFDLNAVPGNHTLIISGDNIRTETIIKEVPPEGVNLGTLETIKAEESVVATLFLPIAVGLILSAIGIGTLMVIKRRRAGKS